MALLTVLFLLAAVAFSFGLVRAVATEIPSLDPANQQAGRQLDTVIYAAPDANGNGACWRSSAATRAASS